MLSSTSAADRRKVELPRDHLRTRGGQGCSHQGLPKATSCIRLQPPSFLYPPACLLCFFLKPSLARKWAAPRMGLPAKPPIRQTQRRAVDVAWDRCRWRSFDGTIMASQLCTTRALSRPPVSLPTQSRSCHLSLVLAHAQLVDADERIGSRLLHDRFPLPGSVLRRVVLRCLISWITFGVIQ